MWIVSHPPPFQQMWVFDEELGLNCRDVTFVPGLYKIFDEILGERCPRGAPHSTAVTEPVQPRGFPFNAISWRPSLYLAKRLPYEAIWQFGSPAMGFCICPTENPMRFKPFVTVYVFCLACEHALIKNPLSLPVNAADNKQRDKSMSCIKVTIDP